MNGAELAAILAGCALTVAIVLVPVAVIGVVVLAVRAVDRLITRLAYWKRLP